MLKSLVEYFFAVLWLGLVAVGSSQINSCTMEKKNQELATSFEKKNQELAKAFNSSLETIHREATTQRAEMVSHVDRVTDDTNTTVHAHDAKFALLSGKLDECLDNWRKTMKRPATRSTTQPTTRL